MLKRIMPLIFISLYLLLGLADSDLNKSGFEWLFVGAIACATMITLTLIDYVFDEAEK